MRMQFRFHTRVSALSAVALTTVALGCCPLNAGAQVLTYHNDNTRSGQNTRETILTPANVRSGSFGKLRLLSADGKVDAEPLYVPSLYIAGKVHNVVYTVTEHDSAYAFDADTGALLWHASVLGSGETPSDPRGCGQVSPEIGITSTPVINPANGAMYVVAASKDSSGRYHQRLHALNIRTGAAMIRPVEIQATYPGNGPASDNGRVSFDPSLYNERAGLLLLNGVVYLSWGSHCDMGRYTGWIMGYNANTLVQTSVLNLTPNGVEGSIWQAGAGPAADSAGNIYFLGANGTFDTTLNASGFPSRGDYGNAFMKVSTSGNRLAVADYFALSNTVSESNADEDLGSGGAMVLPDLRDNYGNVYHFAVGAGKDGNIYVVNRDNMGKFHPDGNYIAAEMWRGLGGREFGMPAYWNNHVYYGAVGDVIRSIPTTVNGWTTYSAHRFSFPGTTPSVSSNGTSNGILWAVDSGFPAVLYAYDATNVARELYDSNQSGSRDQFGPGNKFITPMIAGGKVFVGTQDGVAVFGLLK